MIYLDNSATTKPYKEVLSSFLTVSEDYFGNPSSLHNLGSKASTLLGRAREQIAEILRVEKDEIIFTSGGTESNNLALKGVARANRHKGNHIITTSIEHPSVYNVFQQLKEEGFEVTILPVDRNGVISLDVLEKALNKNTVIVSIMHVNNEVGSIQPIAEAGALIKKNSRASFHVDAIQGFGKVSLNISESNIDLLSLSAHKFHGLKGAGLLYRRKNIPFRTEQRGGDQESSFRSGTENVAGAVSMAKAMRMVRENKEKNEQLECFRKQLTEYFSSIKGVTIVSPPIKGAPHILNVSIPGLKGEVIVHALEREGIYVSTTSACSSKKASTSRTIAAMGFSFQTNVGSVRISMSHSTSQDDVQQFIYTWNRVIPTLMEGIKKS